MNPYHLARGQLVRINGVPGLPADTGIVTAFWGHLNSIPPDLPEDQWGQIPCHGLPLLVDVRLFDGHPVEEALHMRVTPAQLSVLAPPLPLVAEQAASES